MWLFRRILYGRLTDKLWDLRPEISQFKNNDEELNAADSDLDQIRAIASALKVRERLTYKYF